MKKAEVEKLKYELGRYQKKISDQEREIARLRVEVDGVKQVHMMVDAILAVVAEKYGEEARDPDDPEKVLGRRIVLPEFDVYASLKQYEVRARMDETTREYIIGVMERKE